MGGSRQTWAELFHSLAVSAHEISFLTCKMDLMCDPYMAIRIQ